MKTATPLPGFERPARNRSGFTLIETVLASTLFVGIGYVLIMSTRASEQSHRTVSQNAASNDSLREVSQTLRDELRSARRSTIQLNQVTGGNATIRFQTAIAGTGGTASWGVFDRRISPDETLCRQPDWFIQYAVEDLAMAPNSLVRRVIDDTGTTQLTHVMAHDVVSFTVDNTGDVWGLRLETLGNEGMREDEFDVLIRNM